MFRFILNQYLMKRDPEYVVSAFHKGHITEDEMEDILSR